VTAPDHVEGVRAAVYARRSADAHKRQGIAQVTNLKIKQCVGSLSYRTCSSLPGPRFILIHSCRLCDIYFRRPTFAPTNRGREGMRKSQKHKLRKKRERAKREPILLTISRFKARLLSTTSTSSTRRRPSFIERGH
jgi:hypothetical protein